MTFAIPTFEIDLQSILELGSRDPVAIMWYLFLHGGWIPIIWVVGLAVWTFWLVDRQSKFITTVNPILLAIDVPKATEQSPKAVELMFATLLGARSSLTKKERLWMGKFDPIFAFEIVSIDGYIQFLVRTWEKYRDAVEAAIYAQYPDAELTEVEDYTNNVPKKWPNETHDLFGTEFGLAKPDALPIRTYPAFEHGLSAEFKDPMASFLEGLSKVLPGEQVWFQILVQTSDMSKFVKAGEKLVNKMIGARPNSKKPGLIDQTIQFPVTLMGAAWDTLLSSPTEKKRVDKVPRSEMISLSPGEKNVVEAIQTKLSKITYRCKIRFLYIGPKGRLRTGSIIAFVRGALNQFTALDMNKFAFAGLVTTKSDYFWQTNSLFYYLTGGLYKTKAERQQAVFNAYKARSVYRGQLRPSLNIEELATIWHFPVITVKAPVVKKSESKHAEPPVGLPTGTPGMRIAPTPAAGAARAGGPPANLPS